MDLSASNFGQIEKALHQEAQKAPTVLDGTLEVRFMDSENSGPVLEATEVTWDPENAFLLVELREVEEEDEDEDEDEDEEDEEEEE